MITEMLEQAFQKISDGTNLILHSDQGWQYQHKHYQKMLKDKEIRQSMSHKDNSLDNAVTQFRMELEEYLNYYNNRRIKLKLNGLTPAQHRSQAISVT